MRYPAALASLVLLLVTALDATAQSAPPPRLNGVLSTNPLGFLQLGPNLEYERATSDGSSFGFGARLPAFGVMSHVINDGIESGWSVYGVWHGYPKRSRLRGWYVGPHVEFGRTDNETYWSRIYGGGGEFGHRWVKPSGFSIVLGGLLGAFRSNDTWKDGTGSAGDETYFAWMLNLSLGVAK